MKIKFARIALAAAIASATWTTAAVAQGNSHHDGDNQGDDREHDRHDNGKHKGWYKDKDRHDNGKHDGQRQDFRFDDQYRQRFQQSYRADLYRYQQRPELRRQMQFYAGQPIPRGYVLQAVPLGYYRDVPPPAGYQYGYSNGYVVAYNPTTRIIADVLDLVNNTR